MPKSRTVHTRENKKSKQTTLSSITGVNPVRTHGFGVYSGRRKVWSVRVDETLLKQAKPVLKAKFGSECRGVETWLAGLVATTKGEQLTGVYPSNAVEIGKLVIERNIRTRRKLIVEEEKEVTTTETKKVEPCVTQKRPDYSKLPLEELQRLYRLAGNMRDSTSRMLIAYEFKRRGTLNTISS